MTVCTRFAPSPTGALHLGGARTALFNWLFARHHEGRFVLRLEDTDRKRSQEQYAAQIMSALYWLGLDWDGEIVLQSQREARHREVIQQLVDSGHAYYCDCSPERLEQMRAQQQAAGEKPRYDRHCRDRGLDPSADTVVRFRTPVEGEVVISDTLKGEVRFGNSELDDLVIARRGDVATYHLAVVVDDLDAGVTHVIRGDDHLNNTPRQVHILEALGAEAPTYTHLPMILDEQGRKMSKRAQAADVLNYREEGFLPTAVLNVLARLGWAHGDEELFSVDDLVRLFDLEGLNPAASRIDPKKMLWVNQQQMSRVSQEELDTEFDWHCERLELPYEPMEAGSRTGLLEVQRARCRTMRDVATQSQWLMQEQPERDSKAWDKFMTDEARSMLGEFIPQLESIDWTHEAIHSWLQGIIETRGVKAGVVAQPIRVAVTGGSISPSIEDTLLLLGREQTLGRIRQAIGA